MFLLKRSTGNRFSVPSMIHPKPIWSFHSVQNWFHSFFISNYICVFNQSKISNMNLPWEVWNANTQIAEGSTSHDDESNVKQSTLSVFGKNSAPSFQHIICIFRDYPSSTQPFIKILLLFIRDIFVVWFNEPKKPRAPTAAFKNRLL